MLEYVQYPYGVVALITIALLFTRPVWGMALLAATFPLDPWSPRLPVPGVNTETILIGVAFAVTVLRFGARLPPLRFSGPVVAFIAVIFMAFAVSVPWARSLKTADGDLAIWLVFKLWKSITFTSLLFFPAYWWSKTEEDRDRMLRALCVGLFLSSLAGVADYFFHINPRRVIDRAIGLLADPNEMAETIGAMMFVPLYLLMSEHGRRASLSARMFYGFTYLVAGLAVVLSLSRGNWIAMLLAHAVFVLLVNWRLFAVAVVTAVLLAPVSFPFLPQIVRERILMTSQTGRTVYRLPVAVNLESSAASRVVFARIGLDMFENSPIWGNGLHAFNFRTPEFGAKYGVLAQLDPHNLVVKLAADAGAIGLAALAWIVFAVIRTGRRLWHSDSAERLLGAVLLAAATHVLVSNLSTTAFFYAKQSSEQFWILFALAARAYVERGAVAAVPAAVLREPRWRRFAQRTPAALPQP